MTAQTSLEAVNTRNSVQRISYANIRIKQSHAKPFTFFNNIFQATPPATTHIFTSTKPAIAAKASTTCLHGDCTMAIFAGNDQRMTFEQFLRVALQGSNPYGAFNDETIKRLDRLGAFAGKPALRFIATTAVKSGAMHTVLSAGGWNETSRNEIERFIAHTGFRDTLVIGLFEAYVECLGRDDRRNLPSPASTTSPTKADIAAEPGQTYGNATTIGNNTYGEACGETICGHNDSAAPITIIIDRQGEAACGICIDSAIIDCSHDTCQRATISIRLSRNAPMGSGMVHYTFFDSDGSVISSGITATMAVGSPTPFTVAIEIPSSRYQPESVILTVR